MSIGQSSQSNQTLSMSGHDQVVNKMELVYDDFDYERMDFVYKELVDETGV